MRTASSMRSGLTRVSAPAVVAAFAVAFAVEGLEGVGAGMAGREGAAAGAGDAGGGAVARPATSEAAAGEPQAAGALPRGAEGCPLPAADGRVAGRGDTPPAPRVRSIKACTSGQAGSERVARKSSLVSASGATPI